MSDLVTISVPRRYASTVSYVVEGLKLGADVHLTGVEDSCSLDALQPPEKLNHASVLTSEQVREIKAKLRSGSLSVSALAYLYKVSRPTIRSIRDGKTWLWVQ